MRRMALQPLQNLLNEGLTCGDCELPQASDAAACGVKAAGWKARSGKTVLAVTGGSDFPGRGATYTFSFLGERCADVMKLKRREIVVNEKSGSQNLCRVSWGDRFSGTLWTVPKKRRRIRSVC